MKLWFSKSVRKKQRTVAASIEYGGRIKKKDLWVDWTNELGAGRRKVWEVFGTSSELTRKVRECGEPGSTDCGGPTLTWGRTKVYQVFRTFILKLTEKTPIETEYQIEPSYPWNVLGVKKRRSF